MDIQLADRVSTIKPSATLTITARAAELRAAGRDIIGLGAGEPDFDTPEHIKQAAMEAMAQGFTKYTAVDGIPGLKHAIIKKFKADNGVQYEADQILVSCGAKHSFYNLAQALLNPGDEVIIPAPYWVSYPDMVRLAGAVPVIINADMEQAFKITPQQLHHAITPKTRLVVINSPSNPTGAIYSAEELAALGQILDQYPEVVIVSDDIYEHILLQQQPFRNIINACSDLYPRTVILNGVSKTYAMTGWRIGYAAGPTALIQAMKKIQSQSTSNPCSLSQVAAQAALEGDQSCVQEMCRAYRHRHQLVLEGLNGIAGFECLPAQGAFYTFARVQGAIDGIESVANDVELAAYLLDKIGVALVPGSAFGAPGYVRLSFATSEDNLQQALSRLGDLLGHK